MLYYLPVFFLTGRIEDVKQGDFVINHALLAIRVYEKAL